MQTPRRTSPRRPGRLGHRPTLPSATVCLLTASLAGLALWYAARLPGTGGEIDLREWAGLTAGGLGEGRLWEPFTHLFLPGKVSWLLLVELPMLLLAGRHLESVLGRRHVVALFFLGGATGGLAQTGVGWLHGSSDLPVMGPGAGVLAIFIALACVKPEMDVVPPLSPATGGVSWIRIKHGALATVLAAAGTLVAAEAAVALLGRHEAPAGLVAARALAACVAACVYMRRLGFGRRRGRHTPEEEAAWAAFHEDEGFDEPVFAAPTAAAAGRLVVPRFTEVERRMSARQYVSARIDPILDKISIHGIGSLCDEERRALENARQKFARGK